MTCSWKALVRLKRLSREERAQQGLGIQKCSMWGQPERGWLEGPPGGLPESDLADRQPG